MRRNSKNKLLKILSASALAAIMAGGAIAFSLPSVQSKIADNLVTKSSIYQSEVDKNAELTAENEELKAERNEKQAALVKANADLTAARTTLADVNVRLTTAQNDLTAANAAKVELQASLAQANADKEDLQAQLDTATEDKETIQAQYDAKVAEIVTINADIKAKNAQIESFQADVASLTGEKNTLQATVTQLNARVNELQTRVDELENSGNNNANVVYIDSYYYFETSMGQIGCSSGVASAGTLKQLLLDTDGSTLSSSLFHETSYIINSVAYGLNENSFFVHKLFPIASKYIDDENIISQYPFSMNVEIVDRYNNSIDILSYSDDVEITWDEIEVNFEQYEGSKSGSYDSFENDFLKSLSLRIVVSRIESLTMEPITFVNNEAVDGVKSILVNVGGGFISFSDNDGNEILNGSEIFYDGTRVGFTTNDGDVKYLYVIGADKILYEGATYTIQANAEE